MEGHTERYSNVEKDAGHLTGGVAQQLNNVLRVIRSRATFVRDGMGEGDPRREQVDELLQASELATKLAAQLHAFSRSLLLNLERSERLDQSAAAEHTENTRNASEQPRRTKGFRPSSAIRGD